MRGAVELNVNCRCNVFEIDKASKDLALNHYDNYLNSLTFQSLKNNNQSVSRIIRSLFIDKTAGMKSVKISTMGILLFKKTGEYYGYFRKFGCLKHACVK